jgi:transposase
MRFVPVKSVDQQDMLAAHRVRQLLVHQRTALINQVRGLLGERGVTIARSPEASSERCPRSSRSATANSPASAER